MICDDCKGWGWKKVRSHDGTHDVIVLCSECNGTCISYCCDGLRAQPDNSEDENACQ